MTFIGRMKRLLLLSDLDRCCAIWWFYRQHFGITRELILGATQTASDREPRAVRAGFSRQTWSKRVD
ncbi:hypothetical protein E4K65_36435 [Bradyrhizobium niftali]|uniref:Uncharacterized protein n=1 Tax=Bradyrhizobium niftali TaxID=2560055 RepID=A0A4Y9LGA2_9BRAD|nr:hypothetical protein E4K65_36435 [Bradyrhizobium niftali]